MSCPLNAKRWAGSGYVKPDAVNKEAEERIAKMLADRTAQDEHYFPQSKPVQQTIVDAPSKILQS